MSNCYIIKLCIIVIKLYNLNNYVIKLRDFNNYIIKLRNFNNYIIKLCDFEHDSTISIRLLTVLIKLALLNHMSDSILRY